MKTIIKTNIVPERREEVTIYIAEDGKEFYNQSQCLQYEDALKTSRHPVFKSCINNIDLFNDDRNASLYYFSSKEDHDFFLEKMGILRASSYRKHIHDDFSVMGAGWYLYWTESDDYSDYFNIQNYHAYVAVVKAELNEWESEINKKIHVNKTEIS